MIKYRTSLLLLSIILLNCSDAQKSPLDVFVPIYRSLRGLVYNAVVRNRTGTGEGSVLQIAKNRGRVQVQVSEDVPFPCDTKGTRSSITPKSVHRLRPGDIDVIGVIGDSVSAGNGAISSNIFEAASSENRGVSWSGGGQGTWREFLTLPNILKEFNPNLIGYALSDAYTADKKSQLNIAEPGATSKDLPFMTENLIKRMKNDPRVDVENHWKMITFMIGGNDFCSLMCYNSKLSSLLDNHRKNLIKSLRIIRDHLPRTFVSIVSYPNVRPLNGITKQPLLCQVLVQIGCSCIYGPKWSKNGKDFSQFIKEWAKVEYDVSLLPEFQNESFAVVAQPFSTNANFPNLSNGSIDWSYVASDCLHFSQKEHALFANSLWNNLMEPVGNKTTDQLNRLFEIFRCPSSEKPYIATLGNS